MELLSIIQCARVTQRVKPVHLAEISWVSRAVMFSVIRKDMDVLAQPTFERSEWTCTIEENFDLLTAQRNVKIVMELKSAGNPLVAM